MVSYPWLTFRLSRGVLAAACAVLAFTVAVPVRQSLTSSQEQLRSREGVLRQAQKAAAAARAELATATAGTTVYVLTGKTDHLLAYHQFRDALPGWVQALRKADTGGAIRYRKQLDRLEMELAKVDRTWASLREHSALPGLAEASASESLLQEGAAAAAEADRELKAIGDSQEALLHSLSGEQAAVQGRVGTLLFANLLMGLACGLAMLLLLRPSGPVRTDTAAAAAAPDASVEQLHRELDRATDNAFESLVALASLEEQTRVLHSVLRSMRDGVVVVRADGTLLLANPAADSILQGQLRLDPDQWRAGTMVYAADGVTLAEHDSLPLKRALRGEPTPAGEFVFRPPANGAPVWISMTAAPLIGDDGEQRGAVLVFSDISEQRANQETLRAAVLEADRANSAKSEFLSRMSHELRTPLNAILGFAQLLELGDLIERDMDSVAHIMKAGRHLLVLINEVLDISRIESGSLSLSPEPILLSELVEETVSMVDPLLAARGIVLNGSEAALWNCYVIADRQRLTQVLLNLLSNAVKYNREGGSVSLAKETVGDRLRLRISDTGIGIRDDKINRLFQPFERLGAEDTSVEGTGIGLALTKRLVEVMGGTIGVESEYGRGTTFWVEFACPAPTCEPAQDAATADLLAAAQAISAEQEPTVLCIEDNPSNLRLIEHILSLRSGLRLITARQGEAGLRLAQEQLPGLILLDVHLKDMDGGDVLLSLKSDPATAKIPVVVVSADATVHQRERLMKAGARNYLTKPLEVSGLLAELDATFQPEQRVAAGAA